MQWRNERSGVYLGHTLRLFAYQGCLAGLLHQMRVSFRMKVSLWHSSSLWADYFRKDDFPLTVRLNSADFPTRLQTTCFQGGSRNEVPSVPIRAVVPVGGGRYGF
jgi:hypothetical protein